MQPPLAKTLSPCKQSLIKMHKPGEKNTEHGKYRKRPLTTANVYQVILTPSLNVNSSVESVGFLFYLNQQELLGNYIV